MKTIKLYQCSICHTQYADKDECLHCEISHKNKLEIKIACYRPYKDDHSGFPTRITVMDIITGETAVYRREQAVYRREQCAK